MGVAILFGLTAMLVGWIALDKMERSDEEFINYR